MPTACSGLAKRQRLHVSQEGWGRWGRPEPPDLEGSSVRQSCFTAPISQMRTLRPRGGDLPQSRSRCYLSIIRVAELQGRAPTQASPKHRPPQQLLTLSCPHSRSTSCWGTDPGLRQEGQG